MNTFFGSIFWLLVTLGLLITFHEFGHYWVARRCGVKVLRFSVGFGKAIWKYVGRDGTEYQVAAIPLGGYVKMLDAREGPVDLAWHSQEFTAQSVWKRIAIVAAGPAFNMIFTIGAFWLMFILGRPDVAPVVTALPQSMAAQAGIRPGDRLLRIGGHRVDTWSEALDDITDALLGREPLGLEVRRQDGSQKHITLPLNHLPPKQDIDHYLTTLGLTLNPLPPIAAIVLEGQPAAAGGMRNGDRILSINGLPVQDYPQLQQLIASQAAKSPQLHVVVKRHGTTLPLLITARKESLEDQPARWIIGVSSPNREQAIKYYDPLHALYASLSTTWNSTTQTFYMIGKMLTGQASTRNLSGVLGIAQVANASAGMGPAWFLNFLALVSLNLAILNLLPIPILDGGHLLYYLIELLKGSPVSERTMMAGQYIGLALLFTFMGLAFYNDLHRLLFS